MTFKTIYEVFSPIKLFRIKKIKIFDKVTIDDEYKGKKWKRIPFQWLEK